MKSHFLLVLPSPLLNFFCYDCLILTYDSGNKMTNNESSNQSDFLALPDHIKTEILSFLDLSGSYAFFNTCKLLHSELFFGRLKEILMKEIGDSKIISLEKNHFLLTKSSLSFMHHHIRYSDPTVAGHSESLISDYVAENGSHYVLLQNGQIFVCGSNMYGQLGLGNNRFYEKYSNLKGVCGDKIIHIKSNLGSTYLLTDSGKLLVSGNNCDGQLGIGHYENSNIFQQPENLTDKKIVKIFSDRRSTFALTDQGQVYACGNNCNGQLGLGDFANHSFFLKCLLPEKLKIIDVISKYGSTFLITENHNIWTCGSNQDSQLGLPGKRLVNRFEQPAELINIKTSCIRLDHEKTYILDENGNIWTSGVNDFVKLALEENYNTSSFKRVMMIPNQVFKQIELALDSTYLCPFGECA